MIADIIIISIVVIFAIIGFSRGIAKTLLNFAGLILSAICAFYLSKALAQFIYDTFLQQTIIANIEQMILDKGTEYALTNSLDAVPQWISAVISFTVGLFGITFNEYEQNMVVVNNITGSIANSIEGALSSVIVTVLTVILVIVLFIILFLIVKRLIKLINRVFRIPVIKQLNQLLGLLLGAGEGIVFVWCVINLLYMIITFMDLSTIQINATGELFRFFCVGY